MLHVVEEPDSWPAAACEVIIPAVTAVMHFLASYYDLPADRTAPSASSTSSTSTSAPAVKWAVPEVGMSRSRQEQVLGSVFTDILVPVLSSSLASQAVDALRSPGQETQ